ncbi:MAG TPA: hypothetical protein VJN71_02835 [Nitrososphaerales archaeon]|nr:hypothetical protein [Nitrososphaerales archaeon]
MKAELYAQIYANPVYPANRAPRTRAEREKVLYETRKVLKKRGISH